MKSNWSAPFAPWVIKSWEDHLKAIGWTGKRSDDFRSNISKQLEIANDSTLTTNEKLAKLIKLSKG